ncbi:unnamed protein product [Zymoseptoria tritici ST99CH_1A5]|uniref:SnoaL-like domain-containing protein n=3 Tax=Zymoseptoria tritici TaxID=1047171 RepID=A0A1X7RKR3_ZYMT9|nr:unnamed protein product [Zymoseptoria tritici ST99CH_3D7]SMR46533.1 unnamed protein product [Zymoseptoria tritici ST99CH_1E4]SMR47776.1 unnamed protein product [Zymoseptoria tritici ST99CH_3D1]SMY21679.1 unnamed protein product [Zymoseptoria tritici ST99CH_1A5]
MATSLFKVNFPLTPEAVCSHPVLGFYAAYGQAFPKTPEEWRTVPFEDWYSADCQTIQVNGTVIDGGEQSWDFFRRLYASFPKVEREVLSFIVEEDETNQVYKLHATFTTKLFADEGRRIVEVPQSFIYTLGKADPGKGTQGLQFRELRNYYDMRTLESAFSNNA